MKIACVYHPRLHTGYGKFHFVADAFRALGHDVTHVQTGSELAQANRTCDLAVFEQRHPASVSEQDIYALSAEEDRPPYVQWYFDLNVFDDALPIGKQCTLESSMEIARSMDAVFVKERSRLDEYDEAGINAIWLDQGCPSSMPRAVLQESPPFDVVLWGSSGRLWRQRWIDVETLVRFGFKVGWATREGVVPSGATRLPDCQPLEIPSVIAQGKIALCVDAHQGFDGYWSDRIWLAAGAGACVVRRRSEGDGQLPVVSYRSEAALVECVKAFCSDFDMRRSFGAWARNVTMDSHTYEMRCEEVIKYAQTIRDKRHGEKNVPALQGA